MPQALLHARADLKAFLFYYKDRGGKVPKVGPFFRDKRGPRPKGKGELFPFFRRRKKIFEKGVKTLDGMRIIRYNIIDNSVSIFFYRFEFKAAPHEDCVSVVRRSLGGGA